MAFENETKDVILQRMLDRVDSGVDKRQGSVVWDLSSPAAIELAQAYVALDQALTFGFASENTPSDFLDKRVGELGITRKPALKATGAVTFGGTNGVVIPVGTRVSTDEVTPIYFVTTQEGTISNGTTTVTAEAETAGASGNIAQGRIALVLGNLAGVASVTNALAFDGGTDAESDASLLDRYYEKVRKPATSGNAYHYEQWAKEVAGIGDAKVFPLHAGAGTVKVVLLDEDKTAPPAEIVTSAANYIESVRPIGATVTVIGATETPINVTVTVTVSEGVDLTEAQTAFTNAFRNYLKSLAFTDTVVRYSKIASLLLDVTGVVDYADLIVNNGTANVTVANDAVAVVGTVTLS